MSWFNNAELLRIAATHPAAVSAALGFIGGLQEARKLPAVAIRQIAENAGVLAKLGAHPGYSVSDLLRVVRWLVYIADKPDSLRDFLQKMRADLGE
jgi:hypothetical protein